MEATRILAIRHGETAWNVGARIQGQLDLPLNDTGCWQAQRLARALAGREQIDTIFTSDLMRARATAQAVADATGAPLVVNAGLRERCFGALQGRTFAEVSAELPDDARRWSKRDPEWVPPGEGGESLLMFQERIMQCLQALGAENVGKNIAVFTHGGVLDMTYRLAAGLGLQAPRTWQLANTAVNRLLWSPAGGLCLVGWADVSHLEDEALDESTV